MVEIMVNSQVEKPKLFRAEVRDLAVEALISASVLPKENIFPNIPATVPQEMLPAIFVSVPYDHGESKAASGPDFLRTSALVLQIFCDYLKFSRGMDEIETLCNDTEHAIFCNCELQHEVEQFSSVKTQITLHTDSTIQVAEARIIMEFQYSQTFNPDGPDLNEIGLQLKATN